MNRKLTFTQKPAHRCLQQLLFTVATLWSNQGIHEKVDGWTNCGANQTMEYYSALKINEGSSHEGTWRNLECTLSWWRDGAQTVFRAEKLLCDTIIVDKCPYTSVKTHRIYNTESEPHGNWALVNNNVWILVHNGSKVMWEMRGNEEVCGKSLYSPLNFSENRKLKKMKSKDNNPTV